MQNNLNMHHRGINAYSILPFDPSQSDPLAPENAYRTAPVADRQTSAHLRRRSAAHECANATRRRHLSFLLRQFFVRSAPLTRRYLSHSHYAERKIYTPPVCRPNANRSAPRGACVEFDAGCKPIPELVSRPSGLRGMLDVAPGDATKYELSPCSFHGPQIDPKCYTAMPGRRSRMRRPR